MIAKNAMADRLKCLIIKVIFCTFGVAGCATMPAGSGTTDLQFEVLGKIGVRDAERGYSAQFNWRQYLDAYQVEVWGPLGQGRTRLEGRSESATMLVWRGDELLGRGAPEQIMMANLGWSMPVDVLPFWMRGQPHGQIPLVDEVRDESGRFVEFSQAGWQVEMSRYATLQARTPGRIVARQADRAITLVVREFLQ